MTSIPQFTGEKPRSGSRECEVQVDVYLHTRYAARSEHTQTVWVSYCVLVLAARARLLAAAAPQRSSDAEGLRVDAHVCCSSARCGRGGHVLSLRCVGAHGARDSACLAAVREG